MIVVCLVTRMLYVWLQEYCTSGYKNVLYFWLQEYCLSGYKNTVCLVTRMLYVSLQEYCMSGYKNTVSVLVVYKIEIKPGIFQRYISYHRSTTILRHSDLNWEKCVLFTIYDFEILALINLMKKIFIQVVDLLY